MSTFDNFKLVLFDQNIAPLYDTVGSVSKPINYILDYAYDTAKDGLSFMVKYHMDRMKDLQDGATGLYNTLFNNDTNVSNFEYDNMLTYDYNFNSDIDTNSTSVSLSYFDLNSSDNTNYDNYYDYKQESIANTLENDIGFDSIDSIDSIDTINSIDSLNTDINVDIDVDTIKESEISNKVSNLESRQKLIHDSMVALSIGNSVVDVIQFIKDFDDMSAKEKFMFVENFVLSLLPCGNPFGPIFSAVTDIFTNGNISIESFMDTVLLYFKQLLMFLL